MIWILFLYGLIELSLGSILLHNYTIPMIGLTLNTVLSTKSLLDIIIGCIGVFLGPYLVFRGVVIVVLIIWNFLEERR